MNSTLTNLKEFKNELENFVVPPNTEGWSLSNLPTHFWETIGECINDVQTHINNETKQCNIIEVLPKPIGDNFNISDEPLLNPITLELINDHLWKDGLYIYRNILDNEINMVVEIINKKVVKSYKSF